MEPPQNQVTLVEEMPKPKQELLHPHGTSSRPPDQQENLPIMQPNATKELLLQKATRPNENSLLERLQLPPRTENELLPPSAEPDLAITANPTQLKPKPMFGDEDPFPSPFPSSKGPLTEIMLGSSSTNIEGPLGPPQPPQPELSGPPGEEVSAVSLKPIFVFMFLIPYTIVFLPQELIPSSGEGIIVMNPADMGLDLNALTFPAPAQLLPMEEEAPKKPEKEQTRPRLMNEQCIKFKRPKAVLRAAIFFFLVVAVLVTYPIFKNP